VYVTPTKNKTRAMMNQAIRPPCINAL